LLFLVALAAIATFASLNWQKWRRDYLDWRAARTVRLRAERVFRDEVGAQPPRDLVNILGSGELSHWGRVTDIGLTADQIISCGDDRTVRCWSAETGEPLQVITDVQGYVANYSAILLTIDEQQQARVYDTSVTPLKLTRRFSLKGESRIEQVIASQVTSELAVVYAAKSNEVQLFSLTTGKRICSFELEGPVTERKLAFREDYTLLAARHDEFTIINTESGEIIDRWDARAAARRSRGAGRAALRGNQEFRSIVRLRSPWWLVIGATQSFLWHERTYEVREATFEYPPNVALVAVPGLADDAWVAAHGMMAQLSIDPRTEALVQEPQPTTPLMPVTCVAIRDTVNGRRILTERAIGYGYVRGGSETLGAGQIGLLDEYGQVLLPVGKADHVVCVAWNGAGDRLAVGMSSGEVAVLRAGDWAELDRFRAFAQPVMRLEFSPDGAALLCEQYQQIAVFDAASKKLLMKKPRELSYGPDSTLSSGDGRVLAYTESEGWTLTDLATNKLIVEDALLRSRPQPNSSVGPMWSADEQCFVFFANRAVCRLKMVEHRRPSKPTLEMAENRHPLLGDALDFSPSDSRVLLTRATERERVLRIWEWKPPAMSQITLAPDIAFRGAALVPSKKRIAAILGSDLVVLDERGEELDRQPIGPAQSVASLLDFSPDGRYLAIVNGNGTCYLLRSDDW
jgi:WD40 repeat protein